MTETGLAGLITAVATGGAGLGALVFNIIQNRRKDIKDDKHDVTELLSKQLTNLTEQLPLIINRIDEMEGLIYELRQSQVELPVAIWTKNMFGHYVWCNDTCARTILASVGLTKKDIIGKTDEEVWGAEVAKVIKQLERDALKATDRRARRTNVTLHPDLPPFTIYEYVVNTTDVTTPIAYTGIVIDDL